MKKDLPFDNDISFNRWRMSQSYDVYNIRFLDYIEEIQTGLHMLTFIDNDDSDDMGTKADSDLLKKNLWNDIEENYNLLIEGMVLLKLEEE